MIAALTSESGAGKAIDSPSVEAEQLKQRPKKDVGRGGKDVSSQEAVPPRAVRFGHPIKHPNCLLEQHLESAWDISEFGDDKDADARSGNQQYRRHHHAGDQRRVDGAQSEEADLVGFMQHCVAHCLLDGFRLSPIRHGQQAADQKDHCNPQPYRQKNLFVFHDFVSSFLQKSAGKFPRTSRADITQKSDFSFLSAAPFPENKWMCFHTALPPLIFSLILFVQVSIVNQLRIKYK